MADFHRSLVERTLADAVRRIPVLERNIERVLVQELAVEYVRGGYCWDSRNYALAAKVVSPALADLETARFVADDCRTTLRTGRCTHMRRAHLVGYELYVCLGCGQFSQDAPLEVLLYDVGATAVINALQEAAAADGVEFPPAEIFAVLHPEELADAWAFIGAQGH